MSSYLEIKINPPTSALTDQNNPAKFLVQSPDLSSVITSNLGAVEHIVKFIGQPHFLSFIQRHSGCNICPHSLSQENREYALHSHRLLQPLQLSLTVGEDIEMTFTASCGILAVAIVRATTGLNDQSVNQTKIDEVIQQASCTNVTTYASIELFDRSPNNTN